MDWNPHAYLGYVDTIQPNKWHTSDIEGPIGKLETAPEGLGAAARIGPGGLFTLGAQYGYRIPGTPITITPSAGMAYVDKDLPELPLKTPFALGLQAGINIPKTKARLMAEYLHLSNAGRKEPNIGMDMGTLMLGYPLDWGD
jgi:hypothetical protein